MTEWKSTHHFLSYRYDSTWSQLPTLDTEEKTLTGVIDDRDGKSYIIQITPDVTQQQLSDMQYLEGIAKTMLGANAENKLLHTEKMVFHGYGGYRQVYLMHTQPWGLMKLTNLVIRTGTECITMQISFPVTPGSYDTADIPASLKNFRDDLRLR